MLSSLRGSAGGAGARRWLLVPRATRFAAAGKSNDCEQQRAEERE
jgi:hypothetical protein